MDLSTQRKKEIGFATDENQLGFSEILGILKRRKYPFTIIGAIVFFIGLMVALFMPPMYRSTAWIIIEQQSIPKELVNTTITTFADQRIQNIKSRITSTPELLKLINKFSLYPDIVKTHSTEEAVNRMRDNIKLEMQSSEVIDPKSGRAVKANIAFTLAFEYKSAELVQQVASELANMFREMNLKSRKEKAAETTGFLQREAERYSKSLSDFEIKLAQFKQKNAGQLPELVQLNTQILVSAESELKELMRRETALKEKQIYLQSQLTLVDPYTGVINSTGQNVLSPEKRLKALKSRLVSMAASYAPDHPDLIKTKREIEALKKEVGGTFDLAELNKQLKQKKTSLASSSNRYSADHPDVRKLQRDIEQLKTEIRKAKKDSHKPQKVSKPDNPAYIQIQTQLKSLKSDMNALQVAKNQAREKVKDYETKLVNTPEVEREYRLLARGYENALVKYKEFKAKYEAAKVAESLEGGRQAERFILYDPPRLPEKPFKPNRIMILLLSFVAAFAAGGGFIILMDSMDKSIRGYKKLTEITGVAPLATIPLLVDAKVVEEKRHRRNVWVLRVSIFSAVLLVVIYFLS